MNIQETIKAADALSNELESYFQVQTKYFDTQTTANLMQLRAQSSKLKNAHIKYKELNKKSKNNG